MSGEAGLTTKERLSQFEEILNEYNNKVGLGFKPIYQPAELQKYMTLTYDEVSKLDEAECKSASYILSQYAFYLRKEINRHNVRVYWAQKHLGDLLAKEAKKFDNVYGYEQKLAAMCVDNEYAKAVGQILFHAKSRVMELEDVTDHITSISKVYSNMSYRSRNESVRID